MKKSIAAKKDELVEVALSMLEGKMDLILGARKICHLRFVLEETENAIFNTIVAIESETDHLPLGKMRSNCNADYLAKMDLEKEEYLLLVKADILMSCKKIISHFSLEKDIRDEKF